MTALMAVLVGLAALGVGSVLGAVLGHLRCREMEHERAQDAKRRERWSL